MDDPPLDVRPYDAFVRRHARGAASIPLEELPDRVHELPPTRGARVTVVDQDASRIERAVEFLRARGHAVEGRVLAAGECLETGAPTARLWRPSEFLVEALARIGPVASSGRNRAVDVACGSGRDATYLAMRGYAVDAVDRLPDAIARATDLAMRNGVRVNGVVHDLEREPVLPHPPYDVVVVFRYLQRPLFPVLRDAVAPGGHVVYETFHVRNLETGLPPRSAEHLLETGELARAFDGFEMLISRDAVERDGRFFSQLLARRPLR